MKPFGQYSPLDEMKSLDGACPAELLASPPHTFQVTFEERPKTLEWLTEKRERCVSPEFAPFTGTTPTRKPVNISDLFSPVKSPDTRPIKKTPPRVTFRLSQRFDIQTENGEVARPIIPNSPSVIVPDGMHGPQINDNDDVDEDRGIDFGQCTSPVKQLDQASSTLPIMLQDVESQTHTTAVHVVDEDSQTAVHVVDVDSQTAMSYAYLIDASMLTSPAQTADATSVTTPIRVSQYDQEVAPMVVVDTDTLMAPARPISPDHDQSQEDVCVSQDEEGLSVSLTEDRMVTPVKMLDQDTFMTPVGKKDASVLTSPIGNVALRLSDPVLSNLTPLEMRKQLEMTLISNELFRTELTNLQAEKSSQVKIMTEQQMEITSRDQEISRLKAAVEQAKIDTKISMESEISSLQGHVTQMKDEVSSAEARLGEKDKEVMVLKCEKNNLQDDLARIYKQHKQEIADLHADYARKDYKPHFEKAQQVIRKLESEVETYFELMGSLQTAENAQDKLSSAVDEKYLKLKGMEDRILSERMQLDKQQKEFMEGVAVNEMAVRTATSSCQRMKKECEEMKRKVDEADRTINDSQLYQDEILMELKLATEKLATITQEFKENKKNLAAANEKVEQLEDDLMEKNVLITEVERDRDMLRQEYELIKKNGGFFPSPATTLTQPRETMDFLEKENHLLTDSLKEVEANMSAAQLELSRCQNELREKTILYHQQEQLVKQLREKQCSLQSELDTSKVNAHYMLLSQGAELADVSVNVSLLKEKMSEFQEKLKISAARVLKGVNTIPVSQTSAAAQSQGHSFVATLLQAADGRDGQSKHSSDADGSDATPHHTENDDSNYGTEENNNFEIGSSHSAFARVTPGGGLSKRGIGVGSESNGSTFTPVSGKRSPCEEGVMNGTRIETQDMSLSTSCATDQEQSIKDEVDHVIQVLDVVVELVTACEQARDRMFSTVQQENQQLLSELELRQSGRSDLQRLKKSAEESERDQIQANVKLVEKSQELEECQMMLSDMRAKCNELTQQIMGHTEQEKVLNKLNEEFNEALAEIKHLKSEKALLGEELENAVKMMADDGSGEVSRGQYFRDISALRKELHKLKEKFVEKEESYQELKEKASRRMTVLEQNWKLAEDEVFRMDGLIEQIRTTLHENAPSVKSCSAVFSLINLLDGNEGERSVEESS